MLLSQVLDNTTTQATFSAHEPKKSPRAFEVESLPLSSHHGEISGKKGLFVNGQCINIVSDRYEVHQPSKIIDSFQNVANSAGLEVGKIITNPKNGGLLLSAQYADIKILGENHKANLVFYTSHCGKYKTFLTLQLLRVACFNQVPTLYKNKSRHIISEKHYKNSLNVEAFGKVLEGLPAQIQAYNEKAELLQQKSLSFDCFREMYIKGRALDESQKQFDSKMAKFKATYFHAEGQQHLAQNAYKAFQAITYQNTHSGKSTAMSVENALISGGNDSLVWLDNLLTA